VTRGSPEPHRAWLHALEDDAGVPYYALQVARVIADFAASAQSLRVHVSWKMLQRCTHQLNDRLSQSLAYLSDHGWLHDEPRKNGQRQYRQLTTPGSGSGSHE